MRTQATAARRRGRLRVRSSVLLVDLLRSAAAGTARRTAATGDLVLDFHVAGVHRHDGDTGNRCTIATRLISRNGQLVAIPLRLRHDFRRTATALLLVLALAAIQLVDRFGLAGLRC